MKCKQRDAYADFRPTDGDVLVSNFVYTPKENAPKHGHYIIHLIELRKDGRVFKVLDFDDADSALVAEWAASNAASTAKLKPDCVMIPHHCSDNTKLEPILTGELSARSCIITANQKNTFARLRSGRRTCLLRASTAR